MIWKTSGKRLENVCEVVYLPRTASISTTLITPSISNLDYTAIQQIKAGLDSILDIVKAIV